MSVITTRAEGAILEVTLDRPKANAIDLATSRLMGETFRAFAAGADDFGHESNLSGMAARCRRIYLLPLWEKVAEPGLDPGEVG